MFLVDTNVISEPTRSHPNSNVLEWIARHESALRIDPVILGEVRMGVIALPAGRKRTQLDAWFRTFVERIICLPWDRETGYAWAKLVVDLRKKGLAVPIHDCMIAATALVHNLTVVTRDVTDFQKTGVKILNPFA